MKFLPALFLLVACGGGTNNTALSVTITASTVSPAEGDRVTLKANVKGGVGELTYKWEQTAPKTPKLSFTSALLQETQVTVPSLCDDATFELRVSVKDADGNQAAATTSFDVENTDDALELRNVIVSKTSAVVVGDLLTFTAEAVGPGCGPKFLWTQPSAPATGGYEGATNTTAATWRAPETPGTYKVQLVVSDEGGTALPTRDVDVVVEAPKFARDIQPTLNDTCGNCHGGTAPQPTAMGLMPFRTDQSMVSDLQTELDRTPSDGTCSTTPLAGAKFIVGGSLDNSVLWRRIDLDRTMKGSTCDQMPRNNNQFFVQNKDLYIRFKVWIASGASFAP